MHSLQIAGRTTPSTAKAQSHEAATRPPGSPSEPQSHTQRHAPHAFIHAGDGGRSAATATALTSDVQTALAPAAGDLGHTVDSLGDSIYNVTTGTYHGVVQYGKQATGSNTTASNSTAATQVTSSSSLSSPPKCPACCTDIALPAEKDVYKVALQGAPG